MTQQYQYLPSNYTAEFWNQNKRIKKPHLIFLLNSNKDKGKNTNIAQIQKQKAMNLKKIKKYPLQNTYRKARKNQNSKENMGTLLFLTRRIKRGKYEQVTSPKTEL